MKVEVNTTGCAAAGLADAERGDHARANVVAERHSAQQVRPVRSASSAVASATYRAAAEMNRPDRIGVVGFVGMRRHGIGQRRIDGRGHDA